MILREFIFVAAFVLEFGLSANVQSRGRYRMTLPECAARSGECDERKSRQVCGTDNQTYPSKCHLIRAQCSGHEVSRKHKGPCRTCKDAREYALKHRTAASTYVPRCRPDGTYAPLQCIEGSRCWCSDPLGRPLNKSSTGTKKPKCKKLSKSNTRRSLVRHPSSFKNRKPCSKTDRLEFLTKLMKHYENEYNRSGINISPSEKVVLSWKFSTLDLNHNQILDKNEFRELKKLIRRAVKPARCARTFGKKCDVDLDSKLTLTEWHNCLSKEEKPRDHDNGGNSVLQSYSNNMGTNKKNNNNNVIINNNNNDDGNNNRLSFNLNHLNVHNKNTNNQIHTNNYINTKPHNPNSNKNSNNNRNNDQSKLNKINNDRISDNDESPQNAEYEDGDYDEEGDDEDDDAGMIKTLSTDFPSIYYLQARPEQPKEETESDCFTDRDNFLENQNNESSVIYLPECTKDGRYQKVQCYKSTPYCWCVNEENGHPIPDTSVKNKRPQCDSLPTPTKTMKGCPEPKKTKFLKDLKDFFKLKYKINSTDITSDDERAIRMAFSNVDKDSNKIWERKEWKFFRDLVSRSRNLKKCGKRFPRYCDANSDKIVTLSEWLNCLQIHQIETATLKTTTNSSESVTRSSKLIGLNPLEQYLKE